MQSAHLNRDVQPTTLKADHSIASVHLLHTTQLHLLSVKLTHLQGQFLFNMGLVTRVEQVLDADSTTDEQAQTLVQATEKILTGTMGTKFKAIAITNEGLTTPGFNTE